MPTVNIAERVYNHTWKLDPIIRELHGEISAQHQRVTTLEAAAVPQVLEHHAQRLDAAEQQTREYQQALVELQQKLAQVESRSPEPAPSQRVLIGILVAIIALAALVVIKGLLAFVSRRSLVPFAWYRIALGALVAAFALWPALGGGH